MTTVKRTKSFSARFSAEVVDMLDARSERLGQSKARVAERLIEEGLRSEELPGIVFRTGPTGRRAGLAGGPDIWEIARDLKTATAEGATDPIATVACASDIDQAMVELAARYYAAYPGEIDQRIQANEQATEQLQRILAPTPAQSAA